MSGLANGGFSLHPAILAMRPPYLIEETEKKERKEGEKEADVESSESLGCQGCWLGLKDFFGCSSNQVAPMPMPVPTSVPVSLRGSLSLATSSSTFPPTLVLREREIKRFYFGNVGRFNSLLGTNVLMLNLLMYLSPAELSQFSKTAIKAKELAERDYIWMQWASLEGYAVFKREVTGLSIKKQFAITYVEEQRVFLLDFCTAIRTIPDLIKPLNWNKLSKPPVNIELMKKTLLEDEKYQKAIALDLSKQKLKGLPFRTYLPLSLTFLDLRENFLKNLPKAFSDLRCLTELNLSHNSFREIPKVLQNNVKLEFVNFQCNKLTSIPTWLGTLQNLYFLDLSHNAIASLPEEITPFLKMRHFSLASNQLRELPMWLSALKCLSCGSQKVNLCNLAFNFFDQKTFEFIKSLNNFDVITYTEGVLSEEGIFRGISKIKTTSQRGMSFAKRLKESLPEAIGEGEYSSSRRLSGIDEQFQECQECRQRQQSLTPS